MTLVHETARRTIPHAPRVDVIGMRAIAKPMRAAGYAPPPRDRLHRWAFAGDLASNSLYYSLVGIGGSRGVVARGLTLGALAGLGAVLLPKPMGLGRMPDHRTPWTQLLTVCWYTLGGLAAGASFRAIDEAIESPGNARRSIVRPLDRGVRRLRALV